MRKIWMAVTAALLLAGSCTKSPAGGSAEHKEVEIRLTVPAARTRAAVAAEDAIKQVDLLVFDGEGLSTGDAKFLYSRYAWRKSGNTYTSVLKIGAHLDIYVAVNARALVESGELTEGMPWNEVREKLVMTAPDQIDMATDGLPMWGALYDCTVADRPENAIGTVMLLRAVASADVSITAPDFTLTRGYIVYGTTLGYLAFTPSNLTAPADGDYTPLTPEVPAAATSTLEWSHTPTPDARSITNVFYMFENDAPNAGRNSTKLILEGKRTDSSLGGDTFYPLIFRNAGNDAQLPVTRNAKYLIVITSVDGDGYPTLEDAKAGQEVNMNYRVIPWSDNLDGEIMVDGAMYFALASKKAFLPPAVQSQTQVLFETNYALSDVKMAWNATETPVAEMLDSNPRFKVEAVALNDADGNVHTCFRITAKEAYGISDNPSILTVSAGGRIRFNLQITQLDHDDTYWIDGGGIEGQF